MCGRFGMAVSGEALAELLELDEVPEVPTSFNIAPTDPAAVARMAKGQGGRELALLRWGLIPFWAKDKKIGARMINARAESVATKPAFREAFASRRCLVPSDGFYEWHKKGKSKQPFHIGIKGLAPFCMAGLWERWRDPADRSLVIESFTILTTNANALIQPIHDRMPVILPLAAYATWLDPEAPPSALEPLLAPAPASEMEAWPVDRRVGNVRVDDPGLRARQQTLL